MKKFIIFAAILFSVSAAAQTFSETVKEGRLRLDVTLTGGTYGYSESMNQPVFGWEVTFGGVMFGISEYPGGSVYDTKPVHVKSYTKKDGTHVNSYNRARPGGKGSTHSEMLGAELYMGFWIPCMLFSNSNLYAAPIIGVTGQDFDNDMVYGLGLKYIIVNRSCPYGFNFKLTNYSISLGLSIALPRNF